MGSKQLIVNLLLSTCWSDTQTIAGDFAAVCGILCTRFVQNIISTLPITLFTFQLPTCLPDGRVRSLKSERQHVILLHSETTKTLLLCVKQESDFECFAITMTIAVSLKFSEILAATFSATWLGLQGGERIKGEIQSKALINECVSPSL